MPVNLDFYYYSDIYSADHILERGLSFETYMTQGDYGLGIYLTDESTRRPPSSSGDKATVLRARLTNYNYVLQIVTFQDLITAYPSLGSYLTSEGRGAGLGKRIKKVLQDATFNGLYITDEHLLVLYSGRNIKYVKLAQEI